MSEEWPQVGESSVADAIEGAGPRGRPLITKLAS